MKILSYKVFILLTFNCLAALPQNFSIKKIEPPNWWVGMKYDTVQLMVYGDNLEGLEVNCINENLKILKVQSLENPAYLFIDIIISDNLNPGEQKLIFHKDETEIEFSYPIYEREISAEGHKGFRNEDVIYLIFADRFCDGDPLNNTIGDSLDEFTSADLDGRKGGDIEGIISKLDYLNDLGVTALWITPMLENNMWMSYHGYAATDLYKIDPRFGSNELYKNLVVQAHKRGIKIILDHVSNHIGINHYWLKNTPSKDWFNGSKEKFITVSHDKTAFVDIHGDSLIVKMNQQGWFTDYMPDLNQRNPFLKKYLIQNTIWWIEYGGIDGIREDTYPYCDQKYLADWAEVILNEYPNFNIVGEIWQGVPSVISAYQTKSPVRKIGFDSNLASATDFALSDAIREYLSGEKGIYKVYETIAQDIVYSDPDNLLVFFDNHDVDRAMLIAKGNIEKLKTALIIILFTRGIPTIFYGTEIGVEGGTKHGELRQPFPGGFYRDERNAFSEDGRNERENEVFKYLKELLKLRKEYQVLSKGKLRHIYPFENLYVLIKSYENEVALILINGGSENIYIQPSEIKSFLPEANEIKNLTTNKIYNLRENENLSLKSFTAKIFLLNK